MPTLHVVVSDLHGNCKASLFPPEMVLEGDGGPQVLHASPVQVALYAAWLEFWQRMKAKKRKARAKCVVSMLGDLLDINLKDPLMIATGKRSDVVKVGIKLLAPAVDVADQIRIVCGTENHTGGHGDMEELLAMMTPKHVPDLEAGTESWARLPLQIEGVRFDMAHHPQRGAQLAHTLRALPGVESASIAMDYWTMGEPVPDVAIRGHLHAKGDSGRAYKPHTFLLPAWTGRPTAYIHRKGKGHQVRQVGGLWFLVDGDSYTYDFELWKPEGKKWSIA